MGILMENILKAYSNYLIGGLKAYSNYLIGGH